MNKTNIELRKVYLRMKKLGSSDTSIADATGIKIRNFRNWNKLTEEELLHQPDKNTRKPTFDTRKLKQYIIDNPFAFNKEVAIVFNVTKSTIQRWRSKLDFRRKKAKTTYQEADIELKKTSLSN